MWVVLDRLADSYELARVTRDIATDLMVVGPRTRRPHPRHGRVMAAHRHPRMVRTRSDDPAKRAAILDAAQHHALRLDTSQQALADAGGDISAAITNGQTNYIPPDDDPYRDQRRDDQRHDAQRHDDQHRDDRQADKPVWTFIDGATFILDQPDTIPALWGDGTDVLWAEGESLMIAGPMGLGKTTLAVLLMRAQLGLGDGTVLGLPVAERPRQHPVSGDGPARTDRPRHAPAVHRSRTRRARAAATRLARPAARRHRPQAHPAPGLAEAADAQTVYLDSIKDATIGLSDDEVGAGYNRARQQLLAHGVQLAEQHHTVKRNATGGPPTTVADIYGSAWITNGTGSIVMLTGEPGDPIVGLRHVRAPADQVGPFQLLHDPDAGTLTISHTST